MMFVYGMLMNTIIVCFPWFDAFSDGQSLQYCISEKPCESATAATLFEPKHRAVNCRYNGTENYCDRYITLGWYRFDFDLVTYPPALGSCGALYPYWLNGNIPLGYEEEIDGTVCQVGFSHPCTKKVPIRIRNCGLFRAYCLAALDACPERYCFGEIDPTCQSTTEGEITTSVTAELTATSRGGTDSVITIQNITLSVSDPLRDAISEATDRNTTLPNADSVTTARISTLPGSISVTSARIATLPGASSSDSFNALTMVLLVSIPSVLVLVILIGIFTRIVCHSSICKKPLAIITSENEYDHINISERNLEVGTYDQLKVRIGDRQPVTESKERQYADLTESKDEEYVDIAESKDGEHTDLVESKDGDYTDLMESKDGQYTDLLEIKDYQQKEQEGEYQALEKITNQSLQC
ncbi:uncharacterized protein LOC134248300 isoform X2 [Saccostrea cucullata]|uniref:uncharacterized protein LOC134248300 isoform X2 n=1 Tax=Saccostrea cuccullata TaxID=36930 RepID=UPI002ED2B4F7